MPDIQLGLNNQETIDMANAAHKFLNRNNQNTVNKIVITDPSGKITTSPVNANELSSFMDLVNAIGNVDQELTTTSAVVFASINGVLISKDENGSIFVASALNTFKIDETANLSEKAGKLLVAKKPSTITADLKVNYMTNEVDTAEKIATAINSTNTKINALINALNLAI